MTVARSAVSAGARVELVGAVDDDATGDSIVVALGRAGIGHAAMLRRPVAAAAAGPAGRARSSASGRSAAPPSASLDRADVELALGYLVDYAVLVLAEPLDPDAESAALDGAAFHGARVVAVVAPGTTPSERLAEAATVLERPAEESEAFGELLGRFAAGLERGTPPDAALTGAAAATGWEPRR